MAAKRTLPAARAASGSSKQPPGAAVRPPRRTSFHHGDLKNTLVAAAGRAIAAHGIEALSVRALAQELGVAHRAAYRHFADKEQLVAAVLTQAHERLAAELGRAAAHGDPHARLCQAAVSYAGFAFREPKLFFAMTGPRVNERGTHAELESAIRGSIAPVLQAIRDAIREGSLPAQDEQPAALFFWASLQGVIGQILHRRFRVKTALREQVVSQTATRLIAGLTASGV